MHGMMENTKKRIRLYVQYDGTNYHGWQVQQNGITIESELNRALKELTGEEIQVIGASRTDAGVHALCNVAVFDTESRIPPGKFCYALNARLPEDIRITRSDEVPNDWHPRKRKAGKIYEYRICTSEILPPTKRLYCHHVYRTLNVEAMAEGARYLKGEHDFKSFCQEGAQVLTTVREITGISIRQITDEAELIIVVKGNGFLYNMVRIIVGTLLEVGFGRLRPEDVKTILEQKDRSAAGPTAPAKGLLLKEITFYE